jgi:cell division protein FtsI/penicillin-binding protein 2
MATDRNTGSREQHRTSRTLWFLYCLFLALSLVLMGRIVYLQLFWDPNDETIYLHHFQPRKYMHEIEPERGSIMDCNGKLLAFSTPMYNVNMDCTILKDDFAKTRRTERKRKPSGDRKPGRWHSESPTYSRRPAKTATGTTT